MQFYIPGYERVFRKNPDYGRNIYEVQKSPIGTRDNPSGPKLEGYNTLYVANTARWFKKN